MHPYKTRAVPGDPWWESELWHALCDRDAERLAWLVDLADAEERSTAGVAR